MSKKTLFGVDYTDKECIKIILYLFVGGTAALVEWAFFTALTRDRYGVYAGDGCSVLSGNAVSLFPG